MPGKPELSRMSMTPGVRKPRSSAMMGSVPSFSSSVLKNLRPGPCVHEP